MGNIQVWCVTSAPLWCTDLFVVLLPGNRHCCRQDGFSCLPCLLLCFLLFTVCLLVCPADVLCWQTLPLLNQCQRLCLFKLLLPFGLIDGKFCIAGGNSMLEGWEMKGKELIKGFSVLWKKLLHSCSLPTAVLLTRAFTLGSLCVYMHIYLWVAHTWQFSKASWKYIRRKCPPPDTALSLFPQVSERRNFTIFKKWILFLIFLRLQPVLDRSCRLLYLQEMKWAGTMETTLRCDF